MITVSKKIIAVRNSLYHKLFKHIHDISIIINYRMPDDIDFIIRKNIEEKLTARTIEE